MSLYAPGVVAYDIVPPLQYVGADAYRKDYEEFFAQYEGPIDIELRDLHIIAGDGVAFATSLQRISGTLKNGQKSDVWVRVTNGFRKLNGRWLATHDHVSVPVDLASGKAVLDLKP
jgi:ketosteroid isomerase-like protein